MNEKEKIKDLKAVYSGAVQAEKIEMANIIKGGIDLIEKLQKENEELKETYKSEKKMKNEYVKLYQDLLLREEVIPVQKVKDKIEEIQKEYNKLDKQIDEYINDVNKDLAKYYENKEKISIMQTLSCFIDILQELLKESE